MWNFIKRLLGYNEDEVIEIFEAVVAKEDGTVTASEIPTVKVADTSEAPFVVVSTSNMDWESAPKSEDLTSDNPVV